MTLILRRFDSPLLCHLGAAGLCRVSLCEIVGAFGSGPIEGVMFIGVDHARAA